MEQPAIVALAATLLLVLTTTRLMTGRTRSTSAADDVPSMPGYWIPFLAHGPQKALGFDRFLRNLSERHPEGVFSLKIFGSVHSFVTRPSLMKALTDQPESVASSDWIKMRFLRSMASFNSNDMDLVHRTEDCNRLLTSTKALAEMADATVRTLKQHLADWVSFNSQPADQMDWEQVAEADVVDDEQGEKVVEVDLLELTRTFVARMTTPSVFGTDFDNNFPDFPQLVSLFDAHYHVLASGLPVWVPYRPSSLARAARRRLLSYLEEFHTAIEQHTNGEDPGVRWENLKDLSSVLQARVEVFREQNASIQQRAALDFALLWALNSTSGSLVFWMLYEINRDRVLLAQIREEVSSFVDVVQPKNEFGLAVWMAPEIRKMDTTGLVEKCPLLKASYEETLRLYTCADSVRWMAQDATVGDSSDAHGSFLLKKGTYAHASHELHQLDPECYPDPHEWQPARHISKKAEAKGHQTIKADLRTIHHGGNDYEGKERVYSDRDVMAITAALISAYDIEPAGGQKWDNQRVVKATRVKHPAKPVKAWIRRREVRQEQ